MTFIFFLVLQSCVTPRSFPATDVILQRTLEEKSDEVPFDFKACIVGPDGAGVPGVQLAFEHRAPNPIKYRFFGVPSSAKVVVLTSDEDGWITYRSDRGGMISHRNPERLNVHIDGIWYDLDPESGPTQFTSYKPGSRFNSEQIRTSPTPKDPLIYRLIPVSNFNQQTALIAAKKKGFTKESIPRYYQLLPQHGWPPEGSSDGYAADGYCQRIFKQ